MSQAPQPERISLNNEQAIRTLARAITYSQGEFSLILVRCNYVSLRERMMQQLRQQCSIEIQELELAADSKTLYTAITREIGETQPPALIVFGLATVQSVDAVLASTNQVRDEFRKAFAFPLVLWIDDTLLKKLIKQAPDLESWASVVEFEMPPDDLLAFVQTTADRVFEELIEVGAAPFLSKLSRELGSHSRLAAELSLAQQDIQSEALQSAPELAASLAFLLGLANAGSMSVSRQHYEHSLSVWPSDVSLERQGCICYQLGMWWRTHAVQHRAEYQASCLKAVDYYRQAIATFEKAERPDLVAKFINPFGETLQRLEQWNDLETLTRKSLALNETFPNLYRQAEASGSLAEALLGRSAWAEAQQAAERALHLLETAIANDPDPTSDTRQGYIDWQQSFSQGWYLFALGRAQWCLDQRDTAIQTLEHAREKTRSDYDPPLYIQILRTLRKFYFEEKAYLKAFEARLDYRSLEQQYGFRAFVGAGRLQPQRESLNPALVNVQAQSRDKVSQEIAASGRQGSVNRLIERLARADQKLIVLHGQSGVGKSSIIQAGLIPSLTPITLDTRQVITVLQQVYTNWTDHLWRQMLQVLQQLGFADMPETAESSPIILEQLRKSVDNNLMVVLLFDQFEEFFFVHKEPVERKPFYEFLRQCLDIPYIKVVLSLREDYLHYLLECNERLVSLDVIGNNILDKNILFYLGNFSRRDAKAVIQSLTKNTPYPLNEDLTEELVNDLSEELGEVRPIELQVVGAQIQTEQITTLEQYREKGPKDSLVSRFLDEVTQDCGPENEDIARLVLYLLTDENNTRPLKTREDIELEINVSDKLDFILTILVRSGLVFRIPSSPSDRYQLVHDYLVIFVRQGQSTKLIAELEKEREQRQLTEKQLNEALQKQLRTAKRATFTLAGLMTVVTGVAIFAFTAFANLLPITQSDLEGKELDDLIASLQASKSLKQFPGILPSTRLEVLSDASQAAQDLRLLNRWDGHEEDITDIVFSLDGQFIASASKDKTVQLWNQDGLPLLVKPMKHESEVVAIDFSPDNSLILTGTKDGTVSLWKIDGSLVMSLKERHEAPVTDVAFSPSGNKIASSSEDSTVKVWKTQGEYQGSTSKLEIEISGINFSPDGTMIVSFADFDIVRIWDSNKLEEISNIAESYGSIYVSFSGTNDRLNIVDSFHRFRIFSLDGNLITGDKVDGDGNLLTNVELTSKERIYATSSKNTYTDKLLSTVIVNKFGTGRREVNSLTHESGVTSISLSPDGHLIATATEDDYLYLWDITSLINEVQSVPRKTTPIIFDFETRRISSSDKHNSFLISSLDRISSSSKTNLSRTDSLHLNGDLMGFSPVDDYVLLATNANTLRLRNLDSTNIEFDISNDDRIIDSVLNSHKLFVFTSHESGNIRIWNYKGKLRNSIKAHSNMITALEVTQDGNKIVTADETSLKIWNLDGSVIASISGLDRKNIPDYWSWYGDNNGIFLSPDSSKIVTIEASGIAKIWDINGNFIRQLGGHEQPVSNVVFSSDSDSLMTIAFNPYSGRNREVKLWRGDGTYNAENYHDIKIGGIRNPINAWFHPNKNEIFAVFSWANASIIEKVSFLDEVLDFFEGHISYISDYSFSHDGRLLATSSGDNTVILWNLETGRKQYLRGHGSAVEEVSFALDDEKVASIDSEGTIKIWNSKGKEIDSFDIYSDRYSAERGGVSSLEFTADNYLILSNYRYTTLLKIDGTELESFTTFQNYQLSHNKDNVMIAVRNPELKIVDKDGRIMAALTGHSDVINSAVFSPNGETIASASDDNTVILWGRNGKKLKTIPHDDDVNSVAFSGDGKWLATAGENGTIRLFDLEGNPISDEQGKPIELSDHTDSVTSVLFSPDHTKLASASTDGIIRLWNVKTWKQYGEAFELAYADVSEEINMEQLDSLWFSEDGNLLAYGTDPVSVQFLSRWWQGGIWYKEHGFYPLVEIPEEGLADEEDWITVKGNRGTIVLSLGLDHSMQRACRWINDHLQVNENKNDDRLCDEILNY